MANSTLDPDLISGNDRRLGIGHDNDALGPGDTSDSGSDVAGLSPSGVETDSHGTGERSSVYPEENHQNEDINMHFSRRGATPAGDSGVDPDARDDDAALNDDLLSLETDAAEDGEDLDG
jgi:hypothetical protein